MIQKKQFLCCYPYRTLPIPVIALVLVHPLQISFLLISDLIQSLCISNQKLHDLLQNLYVIFHQIFLSTHYISFLIHLQKHHSFLDNNPYFFHRFLLEYSLYFQPVFELPLSLASYEGLLNLLLFLHQRHH